VVAGRVEVVVVVEVAVVSEVEVSRVVDVRREVVVEVRGGERGEESCSAERGGGSYAEAAAEGGEL